MSQLDLLQRTCVHFCGAGVTCRANVRLEDIGASERQKPCLGRAAPVCAHYQKPDPAEVEQQEKEVEALLAKVEQAVHGDICPFCGKPSQPKKQIGRCVYGACGCRLYQGRLKVTP